MSKQPSYQELSSELETIIASLQEDVTAIDTAVEQYKRGLAIVKQLDERLKITENTISELKASFTDV